MPENSKKKSQKSTKHSIKTRLLLSTKRICKSCQTLLSNWWMGVKLFFSQTKDLKKSFFPQVKEMFCTVAQQVGEKALHFSQTLFGIATIAIIVGFFLGVLWMS
jgi:hypothetical protein